MAWRLILVLLSVAAHFVWLYTDRSVQPQLLSGGAQNLPVSMNLTMVTLETAPEKEPEKQKPEPPVKEEVRQKPPEKEMPKQQQSVPPRPKEAEKKRVEKPVAQSEPSLEKESQEPQVLEESPQEVAPQQVARASTVKQEDKPPGLESLPVVREVAFRSRPLPPVYPKLSLRKRQQGEALVQALVDTQGDTQDVKLVRSSGYKLLDQSALEAVRGWQFQAARVDGNPVAAWVEVPVAFQIN